MHIYFYRDVKKEPVENCADHQHCPARPPRHGVVRDRPQEAPATSRNLRLAPGRFWGWP